LFIVVPPCRPSTTTENVHEPPAASVPPVRLTVELVTDGLFTTAVIVPLPHVPVTVVDCSLTLLGIESENATPVSGMLLGLLTVKLSVDVCPAAMVDGVNDFVTVGGPTTLSVADAGTPVPPLVDVGAVVFTTLAPGVVPVTVTLNWHVLFTAMVPPENVSVLPPVVVSVPPH